jgi:putative ABC transport system substrate-binding protein
MSSELAAKRVQLLNELLPAAKRIALLWDARNANARAEVKATISAIHRLRLVPVPFELASEADLPRAFDGLRNANADALYVAFEGGTVASHRTVIAEFGVQQRMPVISGWSDLTEAGALASYAPDLPAMYRRSAYHVHRILLGTKPSDLPFEQASTFELVVNLRTAKALGLTIPADVLLRANRQIA